MSTYTDASLIVTPNAVKSGKLYSLKGADLNVVRNTTATYVGADGLIKTALANVPRLDYTNGSCPSILVESQRTNLFLYSQEFNNSYWTKIRLSPFGSGSVANTTETLDPFGNNNSDYIKQLSGETTSGGIILPITYNEIRTTSIFVKKKEKNFIFIRTNATIPTLDTWFNLENGTVGVSSSFHNATIQDYGNGWYRCSVTTSIDSTRANFYLADSDGSDVVTDVGGVYLFGAQLEAGSNATSIIPTEASIVTRNADVVSKSGLTGITTITETFENGTTNVISGSPTSYTMSQGRIKNVIGI